MTTAQDGRRGSPGPARSRVRETGAAVLAALPPAALIVAMAVLTPRLGTTIASHWSGSAAGPDGFSSTWGSFWLMTAVTAGLFAFSLLAIVFVHRASWSRIWPSMAAMVGGLLAASWLVSAWASAAAPSLAEASLGPRLLVLILAPACGAAVYLLLPPAPAPHTAAASRPRLAAPVGITASWTAVITGRALEAATGLLAAVFLGSLVVALITGSGTARTASIILLFVTLTAALLVPVRLTVDRRGIRLVSVLLRVPLIRIRLENVTAVTADTIDPMRWGGWGYRISGAGIAYVARRGPGIVITRNRGGAVAITVDHPEVPAALANGLIAALPAAGRRG